MRQSTLGEHETSGGLVTEDGIRCPKGCGRYQNLASHWQVHDEPLPDDIPTVTKEISQKRSEFWQGRSHSEEAKRKISESHMGKTRSEETKRKLAEANRGKTLSEETKQKISEATSGENNPMYGVRGEDAPGYGRELSDEQRRAISEAHTGKVVSEETREKLAEANREKTLSEETKQKISEAHTGRVFTEEHKRNHLKAVRNRDPSTYTGGHHGGYTKVCVVPTRHEVNSGWERDIDLMLYDAGVDFQYEPRKFGIGGGRNYTPDFQVRETIIEVKGYDWGDSDDRAERFMEHHPEYRYVVIGNGGIPCDIHFDWQDRQRVLDIL